LLLVALFAALVLSPEVGAEGWTVKRALREIDRALSDLRAVEVRAEWNELFESQRVDGAATMWIDLAGRVRADVEGDNPRTILSVPPYLWIYRPLEGAVERFFVDDQPDLLAQYVVVGFVPGGSALNKRYKVKLVREDELDGRLALLFELVPKDEAARAAVPAIMLWVDRTTWLPAQQLIRHGAGGLQVTVRYVDLTPVEQLPAGKFRPQWPEGTELIGH
jgi:outer membrane lipoprotein-sorting protein